MHHPRATTAAGRRRVRRATLAATIALIAATALGACGGGTGRRAARSPAAATFIDLVPALPAALDPASPDHGAGFAPLMTSLAGTLVRPVGVPARATTLAGPARVTGYLARQWSRESGGDYVFRLRSGITSAYGHTLTAADVRFSFERELALSVSARALARLAGIDLSDPITVLGPHAVRLNATGRGTLALAVVGGFRFGILDRRAVQAHSSADDPHSRAWLAGHLAFYGAYRLASFSPGVRVLLVTAPRWPARLAFGHVAIEADPRAPLRLADVGASEASHTLALGAATFAAAMRTNGITARLQPSTAVGALVPNERVPPLARVAVRRALSLALDRDALAHARLLAGTARPALWPVPSTIPLGAGVTAPHYRHDTTLARRLLAAAGYPHGFALTIACTRAERRQDAGLLSLIAAELRPLGIIVRTRTVASDAALASLMRRGGANGALVRLSAPIASVPVAIAACCLAGSPANLGGYRNRTLGSLAATAARGSPAERLAATQRALDTLAATMPTIPLVELPSQNVTLASIAGYAAFAAQATYYDRLRS